MAKDTDIIHRLKQILGKYEQTKGIQILGSEDGTINGTTHVLKVDSDGKLEIGGSVSVSVNLEYDDDSVTIYGHDGSQYNRVKVDSNGKVSVYTP